MFTRYSKHVFSFIVAAAMCQPCFLGADELKPKATSAYQIVTGDDTDGDRTHWDAVYDKTQYVYGKEPAKLLKESLHYAKRGRALDIATGEGRNAVFLARNGFEVDAVDISEVGLKKTNRLAKEFGVSVKTIAADLNTYQIKPESYDLIVNIHFLLKDLIPKMKKGLKKGGLIIYETYTVEQLKNPRGKSMRRDFLLEPNELKSLFKDLEIIYYREANDGELATASLVARKLH